MLPLCLLSRLLVATLLMQPTQAGLLRQATYTTARMGMYTTLLEKLSGPQGEAPNLAKKVLNAKERCRLQSPPCVVLSLFVTSSQFLYSYLLE